MKVSAAALALMQTGGAALGPPPKLPGAAPVKPGRRKYGNVPTVADGVTFASRKEARRYRHLKLLEAAGEITGLELQPRFDLAVNGVRVGRFTGDFAYRRAADGVRVVEDVKSPATRRNTAYRLRKRLLSAVHGIEVTEV